MCTTNLAYIQFSHNFCEQITLGSIKYHYLQHKVGFKNSCRSIGQATKRYHNDLKIESHSDTFCEDNVLAQSIFSFDLRMSCFKLIKSYIRNIRLQSFIVVPISL